MTPRLALVLVEMLPSESAFVTAKRGGSEFTGWDRSAYLQADLFDAVMHLAHITVQANSKKPKSVKEPKPYPRPDETKKEPDILLKKLRGEAVEDEYQPPRKAGPGKVIFLE